MPKRNGYEYYRSKCGLIELRLGEYQAALSDLATCDSVITDPPYSERTHKGQRSGSDPNGDTTIGYSHMDPITVSEFCGFATKWASKWICIFSDHFLAREYGDDLLDRDWYVFAPVVWVKPNMPRFIGDGPSSTCDYITIARRRVGAEVWGKGSRPGHYIVKAAKSDGQTVGRKDLDGMRALIRDYSSEGDLIVDPYAGSATSLIAAAMENRRAVGCEANPETYKKAVTRIKRGYTPTLF